MTMSGHRHFPATPTITLLCTLAAFAALPALSRADVGQDPGTRPEAERLASETLAQWSPWGGEVTAQELDALKPALIGYYLTGGTPEEAGAVYRDALTNGCRGACLVETLACMTEAVEEGVSCAEALHMVAEAQRTVSEALRLETAARGAGAAAGGNETRARMLRDRMDDMLATR
jgi:hypothetical protein